MSPYQYPGTSKTYQHFCTHRNLPLVAMRPCIMYDVIPGSVEVWRKERNKKKNQSRTKPEKRARAL